MPKYIVKVAYTMTKDITVYADDEESAGEKACDIVDRWQNVLETEALEIEEE